VNVTEPPSLMTAGLGSVLMLQLAAANACVAVSPNAVTANETAPIARQISALPLDLARTAHPGFIIVALLYR
jgi:hypothetical protein